MVVAAVAAPLLAPHDPTATDLDHVLSGPSALHPLGTDSLGRDVLSRLMYGGQVSLLGVAVAVGSGVGVPVGSAVGVGVGGDGVDLVLDGEGGGVLGAPVGFDVGEPVAVGVAFAAGAVELDEVGVEGAAEPAVEGDEGRFGEVVGPELEDLAAGELEFGVFEDGAEDGPGGEEVVGRAGVEGDVVGGIGVELQKKLGWRENPRRRRNRGRRNR